jgi:hypothetical protein
MNRFIIFDSPKDGSSDMQNICKVSMELTIGALFVTLHTSLYYFPLVGMYCSLFESFDSQSGRQSYINLGSIASNPQFLE